MGTDQARQDLADEADAYLSSRRSSETTRTVQRVRDVLARRAEDLSEDEQARAARAHRRLASGCAGTPTTQQ